MKKFVESLRNLLDRIRASITVKKQNVLFFIGLTLIVIMAIVIRTSPLIIDNFMIKAFDPWIQYYNANYLSQHTLYEYFNWRDFKSWFPEGFYRGSLRPGLTFTVVIIYKILNGLGIPVSLYDICYFFPAFMGGLTVLASYLLGKEVLDKKCGILFAFFMAFNPGFMQRTVAGFFDNETIGVFSTLMTFFFFIKAVRTGKLTHAILGGVFLGYLSLSWGGYNFIFYLLPIICLIIILIKKYTPSVLIAYTGVVGVGLLIFSLYVNFNFNDFFTSLDIGGIFFFTILLIIFHLIYTKREDNPKLYNMIISILKWSIIPGAVVIAVLLWVNPDLIPLGIGNRLLSILSPLIRNQLHLVASVAEHSPSAWSVFYYNTLIPLMLLPLGIFFAFKRSNPADIFLILFLLTIFYFTSSMVRIILLFAPAASLAGAYGLSHVLKIFGSFFGERKFIVKKRKKQLKTTVGRFEIGLVFFIVGIMCFAQVSHASTVASNELVYSQITPGGQFYDWEESLTWMKTNFSPGTVVVSWWDYGYWITAIGNVTSVNDNATVNSTRIGLTGMAFMQTNEIYSAKIFKRLKADYVLVYFGYLYSGLGGDEGKWQWMLRICNDHYERYKKMGLEEDNWAENTVFNEAEYYNSSSQTPEPKWFQTQLVRLMFYGLPTTPVPQVKTFTDYYRNQINTRTIDDGRKWVDFIPENGKYDFKVFRSTFNSTNGLVKIYKLDYTALESSFKIINPKVYDDGHATFDLKNTGTKNLTITGVKLNGQSFNYALGTHNGTNKIKPNENTVIWVNTKIDGSPAFKENDVVNITVEAKSIALDGKDYTFSNYSGNVFVKKAIKGQIKINAKNTKVVQLSDSISEIYLEVENVGDTVEFINLFYLNNESNPLTTINFINGSAILKPGEKALILAPELTGAFYPIKTSNVVGVKTMSGIKAEIKLTSSYDDYGISIMDRDRLVSPEEAIISSNNLYETIPFNLGSTHAYIYSNGTTWLDLQVKNTGNIITGIESIYIGDASNWYSVIFPPTIVNPGQTKQLHIRASDYMTIHKNDKIGILVTTNFDGSTKASDIGYIHVIEKGLSIKILDNVGGKIASFITANETGNLLIKNTGDKTISLNNVILNNSITLNVENDTRFIVGDKILSPQECALISFNINGLKINESNLVNVNVTTNTTASATHQFTAIVNSTLYNIDIDDPQTTARDSQNLVITINNLGLKNVTVDSVYVNNTFIGLSHFTENIYTIIPTGFIQLTISMNDLESLIGTVNVGDKLRILVITREGAQDLHEETVIS